MLDVLVEWANNLWTLWLMIIFIGIAAWAYWPGRKRELEAHGHIPLDDDR